VRLLGIGKRGYISLFFIVFISICLGLAQINLSAKSDDFGQGVVTCDDFGDCHDEVTVAGANLSIGDQFVAII